MSSEDFEDQDGDTETGSESEESYSDTGAGETGYIAAEEKKPLSKATLVLFAIFGTAALASYFLLVKRGPEAIAEESDPTATTVINQYMNDKGRNVVTMQKMLRDTDAVVRQFLTYPSVTQIPLTDLRTNPFRVAPPPPPESGMVKARDEEKEKKRREEERQAALHAVQGLQLQSVMSSDKSKSCMINNVLYLEGQQVEDFTIMKISPNAVVVKNGVFKFELRMQR